MMQEKVTELTEKSINEIVEKGIQPTNLDHLYKLVKIRHMIKEEDNMYGNYGNYGNYGDGYGDYGRYGYREVEGRYNARGYDRKYRGHDHMDRMYDNYGRYEEGKEAYRRGNYGAKEDTTKSLEYMLESMVDFVKMLKEEANSQEEINLIRKYTKQISEM